MFSLHRSVVLTLLTACFAPLLGLRASAEEAKTDILQPGKFPSANSGTYIAGELVIIDPINRRGGLRVHGDNSQPLHYFAMLPYGMIWYHGAPAELRDIPIGTHMHGYFHLPPAGEEATIPPLPEDQSKFQLKHNHAVSLEDDFSFYERRGQGWKVVSINTDLGKLKVAPTGDLVKDGINTPYTFDVKEFTQVWKGRQLVELADLAPEQEVRFNLTWSQGWRDKEFTAAEIWLDDASQKFASELQRKRHVRYQKEHWLPGWIDQVEDNDYGGGIVTLTLFGGMDPSLYAELKATQEKGFAVAVAEKTLRTWFHRSDRKIGQVLEWKEIPNPSPGSSGIQLRMKFTELLEGYRPGRMVRVKCHDWIFVTMPPEERVKSIDEQKRANVFSIP